MAYFSSWSWVLLLSLPDSEAPYTSTYEGLFVYGAPSSKSDVNGFWVKKTTQFNGKLRYGRFKDDADDEVWGGSDRRRRRSGECWLRWESQAVTETSSTPGSLAYSNTNPHGPKWVMGCAGSVRFVHGDDTPIPSKDGWSNADLRVYPQDRQLDFVKVYSSDTYCCKNYWDERADTLDDVTDVNVCKQKCAELSDCRYFSFKSTNEKCMLCRNCDDRHGGGYDSYMKVEDVGNCPWKYMWYPINDRVLCQDYTTNSQWSCMDNGHGGKLICARNYPSLCANSDPYWDGNDPACGRDGSVYDCATGLVYRGGYKPCNVAQAVICDATHAPTSTDPVATCGGRWRQHVSQGLATDWAKCTVTWEDTDCSCLPCTITTTTTTSTTLWKDQPRIILSGDNPQYLTVGDNWVEPGVLCFDPEDGFIHNRLVKTPAALGVVSLQNYEVTYTCRDSQNNRADVKKREVNVRGLPLLSLASQPSISLASSSFGKYGNTYCRDVSNIRITGSTRTTLFSRLPGDVLARQLAHCLTGCQWYSKVHPAVTGCELSPTNCYVHTASAVYNGGTANDYFCWKVEVYEPGGCCLDYQNGPLAAIARLPSSLPSTQIAGDQQLFYTCTDDLTRRSVSQTLSVRVDALPTMTFQGNAIEQVTRGAGYTDAGVVCQDVEDGQITELPLNAISKLNVIDVRGSGFTTQSDNVYAASDGIIDNSGCRSCFTTVASPGASEHWVRFDFGTIRIIHKLRYVAPSLGSATTVNVGPAIGQTTTSGTNPECGSLVQSTSTAWTDLDCHAPLASQYAIFWALMAMTICEVEFYGTAGPKAPNGFTITAGCSDLEDEYIVSSFQGGWPKYESVRTGDNRRRTTPKSVVYDQGSYKAKLNTVEKAAACQNCPLPQAVWQAAASGGCVPVLRFDPVDTCSWLYGFSGSATQVECADGSLFGGTGSSHCAGVRGGLARCPTNMMMCQVASTDPGNADACQADCSQGVGGGFRACGAGSTPGIFEQNAYFLGDWQGTASSIKGEVGVSFTAEVRMKVTHLGRHERSGTPISADLEVSLWSTVGNQKLGSATVGPLSPKIGNYRYTVLTSPIVLEAGREYRLTQTCDNGMTDLWYDGFVPANDLFSGTMYRYASLGNGVNSAPGSYGFPNILAGLYRRAGMVTFRFTPFPARVAKIGAVNINLAGVYHLLFSCSDSMGQLATIQRQVTVGCEGPNPSGIYGGNEVTCNDATDAAQNKASFLLCQAWCLEDADCEAIRWMQDTTSCQRLKKCDGRYTVQTDAAAINRRVGYCKRVDEAPWVELDTSDCCVNQFGIWNEGGYRCRDLEDNPPPVIVKLDNLDTSVAGTYTIRYSCTDSSGLSSDPTSRSVLVRAPCTPPTYAVPQNGIPGRSCTEGSNVIHHGSICSTKCQDTSKTPAVNIVTCITPISGPDFHISVWDFPDWTCGENPCTAPTVQNSKFNIKRQAQSCTDGLKVVSGRTCTPNCADGYVAQPLVTGQPTDLLCTDSVLDPAGFYCRLPAVSPRTITNGNPEVLYVDLEWDTGDLNDCVFSKWLLQMRQTLAGFQETSISPGNDQWQAPPGCMPADLTDYAVRKCVATGRIEGATYELRVKTECTVTALEGTWMTRSITVTMRIVYPPVLLFNIPNSDVTFDPVQLMIAWSVDVRRNDVNTWGIPAQLAITVRSYGTHCTDKTFTSNAAGVKETVMGTEFVQLTGRRIIVVKPEDGWFQEGCNIETSLAAASVQTIDTPSKPSPPVTWRIFYIDVRPDIDILATDSRTTVKVKFRVRWTLPATFKCTITPNNNACLSQACYTASPRSCAQQTECYSTETPEATQAGPDDSVFFTLDGLYPGTEYNADCSGIKVGKPHILTMPIPASKLPIMKISTLPDEVSTITQLTLQTWAMCSDVPDFASQTDAISQTDNLVPSAFNMGYTVQVNGFKVKCIPNYVAGSVDLNPGQQASLQVRATVTTSSTFATVVPASSTLNFRFTKGTDTTISTNLLFEVCPHAYYQQPNPPTGSIQCRPYALSVQCVDLVMTFHTAVLNPWMVDTTQGHRAYAHQDAFELSGAAGDGVAANGEWYSSGTYNNKPRYVNRKMWMGITPGGCDMLWEDGTGTLHHNDWAVANLGTLGANYPKWAVECDDITNHHKYYVEQNPLTATATPPLSGWVECLSGRTNAITLLYEAAFTIIGSSGPSQIVNGAWYKNGTYNSKPTFLNSHAWFGGVLAYCDMRWENGNGNLHNNDWAVANVGTPGQPKWTVMCLDAATQSNVWRYYTEQDTGTPPEDGWTAHHNSVGYIKLLYQATTLGLPTTTTAVMPCAILAITSDSLYFRVDENCMRNTDVFGDIPNYPLVSHCATTCASCPSPVCSSKRINIWPTLGSQTYSPANLGQWHGRSWTQGYTWGVGETIAKAYCQDPRFPFQSTVDLELCVDTTARIAALLSGLPCGSWCSNNKFFNDGCSGCCGDTECKKEACALDSDLCLQAAWDGSTRSHHTCQTARNDNLDLTWQKDMYRCCPQASRVNAVCNEVDCNNLAGQGSCDYPNLALTTAAFTLSGATGDGVNANGVWYRDGTYNGKPKYTNAKACCRKQWLSPGTGGCDMLWEDGNGNLHDNDWGFRNLPSNNQPKWTIMCDDSSWSKGYHRYYTQQNTFAPPVSGWTARGSGYATGTITLLYEVPNYHYLSDKTCGSATTVDLSAGASVGAAASTVQQCYNLCVAAGGTFFWRRHSDWCTCFSTCTGPGTGSDGVHTGGLYAIGRQASSPNTVSQSPTTIGTSGGSCTCPNGEVYQAGSSITGGTCASLACVNGVAGACIQDVGPWMFRQVVCAQVQVSQVRRLLPVASHNDFEDHDKCNDSDVTCGHRVVGSHSTMPLRYELSDVRDAESSHGEHRLRHLRVHAPTIDANSSVATISAEDFAASGWSRDASLDDVDYPRRLSDQHFMVDVGVGAYLTLSSSDQTLNWNEISFHLGPVAGAGGFKLFDSTTGQSTSATAHVVVTGQGINLPFTIGWRGVAFLSQFVVSFVPPIFALLDTEVLCHSPSVLRVKMTNVPHITALTGASVSGGGYDSPSTHLQLGVYKAGRNENLCGAMVFPSASDWTQAQCEVQPGALSDLEVDILQRDYATGTFKRAPTSRVSGQLSYKAPQHDSLKDAGDWARDSSDGSVILGMVAERSIAILFVIGTNLPPESDLQLGGATYPGYRVKLIGDTEVDLCESFTFHNYTTQQCNLKKCIDISGMPEKPQLMLYLGDLSAPAARSATVTLPRPDVEAFGPTTIQDIGQNQTMWFRGNHFGERSCQSVHQDATQFIGSATGAHITVGSLKAPCVVYFQNDTFLRCSITGQVRDPRGSSLTDGRLNLPLPNSNQPITFRLGKYLQSQNTNSGTSVRRLQTTGTARLVLEVLVNLFPCPAGERRIRADLGLCEPCSPGRYSTTLSPDWPLTCTRCSRYTYSDNPGATACKACPANTYSVDPANSREACVCQPGYYSKYYNETSKTSRSGTDCVSCSASDMTASTTKGEKCGSGDSEIPVVTLCTVPKADACVSESGSLHFKVCKAYCPGGTIWPKAKASFNLLTTARTSGSLFQPTIARCVPNEACLAWNQCRHQYTGYGCGECVFGYFRDDKTKECLPCGSAQVLGTIVMAGVASMMLVGGLFFATVFMRLQSDIVFRDECFAVIQSQAQILASSKAMLVCCRARDLRKAVIVDKWHVGSNFRWVTTGDLGIVYRVAVDGQVHIAGLHSDSPVRGLIEPHWKLVSVNGARPRMRDEIDVKKLFTKLHFPLKFIFHYSRGGRGGGKIEGWEDDRKMGVMLIGVLNSFAQVSQFDFDWPPLFTLLSDIAARMSFSLNFFKPECSVETPYNVKWVGFLSVPYLMMIPLTISYLFMLCWALPGSTESAYAVKKWLVRNAFARTVNMSILVMLPFHLDQLLVPMACVDRANGVFFVSATPDTECSSKDKRYTQMLTISIIGFMIMTFFYSLLLFSIWKSFKWQFGYRVRDTIPFYVAMVEVSVFGQRGYIKETRERVMSNVCAVKAYEFKISMYQKKQFLLRAVEDLGPRSRWVQDAARAEGKDVKTMFKYKNAMNLESTGSIAGEESSATADVVQRMVEIAKGKERWLKTKFATPEKDGNVITYGWVLIINLFWRQLLSLVAIKMSAGDLVVVGAAAIMVLHAGNVTALLLFKPYKSAKVSNVETVLLSALFLVLWCAVLKDLLSNHINVHLYQKTLDRVNTAIDAMAVVLMILVGGVPLYQVQEMASKAILAMRSNDTLMNDIHMATVGNDEKVKREANRMRERQRLEDESAERGLRMPPAMGRKHPALKKALERINTSSTVDPSHEQRRRFRKFVQLLRNLREGGTYIEKDNDESSEEESVPARQKVAEERRARLALDTPTGSAQSYQFYSASIGTARYGDNGTPLAQHRVTSTNPMEKRSSWHLGPIAAMASGMEALGEARRPSMTDPSAVTLPETVWTTQKRISRHSPMGTKTSVNITYSLVPSSAQASETVVGSVPTSAPSTPGQSFLTDFPSVVVADVGSVNADAAPSERKGAPQKAVIAKSTSPSNAKKSSNFSVAKTAPVRGGKTGKLNERCSAPATKGRGSRSPKKPTRILSPEEVPLKESMSPNTNIPLDAIIAGMETDRISVSSIPSRSAPVVDFRQRKKKGKDKDGGNKSKSVSKAVDPDRVDNTLDSSRLRAHSAVPAKRNGSKTKKPKAEKQLLGGSEKTTPASPSAMQAVTLGPRKLESKLQPPSKPQSPSGGSIAKGFPSASTNAIASPGTPPLPSTSRSRTVTHPAAPAPKGSTRLGVPSLAPSQRSKSAEVSPRALEKKKTKNAAADSGT